MPYVAYQTTPRVPSSGALSFDLNYTSTLRSLASIRRSLQWPPSPDSLIQFGLLSDLRGGGANAEEVAWRSGYSRQPAGVLRPISLGAFANLESVAFRFERASRLPSLRAMGLFVDGRLTMTGDLRQLSASASSNAQASFAPGSILLFP